MAKTLKRQRARVARLAAQVDASTSPTTQRATPPEPLSDQQWSELERHLLGLLAVKVDDTLIDLDHMCLRNVWLVVRLDLIHARAHEQLILVLRQALDALATLCVHSERRCGYQDAYHAFWMRVLLSDMMVESNDEDDEEYVEKMETTIQFTQALGLRVKLSWTSRPFQTSVATTIRGFLNAPRFKYELLVPGGCGSHKIRPLGIALQFKQCSLQAADLVSVLTMLSLPDEVDSDISSDPQSMLCERGVLRELCVAGNQLDAAELDVIASILESPRARRLDALSLKDTMPHDANHFNSALYITAFRRVMVAAFQSPQLAHKNHGFSLSLAKNHNLQPVHIEALQDAVTGSGVTRPLRTLSLKCFDSNSHGTWARLGKLFFSCATTASASTDAELNLCGIAYAPQAVQSMRQGLAELVTESIVKVQRALISELPVFCRVVNGRGRGQATGNEIATEATQEEDGQDGDKKKKEELPPSPLLQITSVRTDARRFDGWFQVSARPSEEATNHASEHGSPRVSMWVNSHDISCIRIDGREIVGPKFTNLRLQPKYSWDDVTEVHVPLMEVMGFSLRRLAFADSDRMFSTLPTALESCPRLEELHLHMIAQHDYKWSLWGALRHAHYRLLQVLSVHWCHLTNDSVVALKDRLAEVPNPLALRYLGLSGSTCGAANLAAVSDILRQHRAIECVVLDRVCEAWEQDEYDEIRAKIDKQVRDECLTMAGRLAFLSVLPGLSPHLQCLDNGVVHEIFRCAGSKEPRTVAWW